MYKRALDRITDIDITTTSKQAIQTIQTSYLSTPLHQSQSLKPTSSSLQPPK
jgi:hypothetical protein